MDLAEKYVLVTPARNEAAYIQQTIDSVVSQTILPEEWIVVDDCSIDNTPEIILAASKKHAWIRPWRRPDHTSRNWSSVVYAMDSGCRRLTTQDYSFIGFLDADVRFKPDYFKQLIGKFYFDSTLGLAGGHVVDFINGEHIRARHYQAEVAGAAHFFRRECFESLGGLIPIPEGGWDTATAAMARMNGYRTRTFYDLVVDHLKPLNSSEGGGVRRFWQMGRREYAVGNHPLFEFVKCCGRLTEPPYMLGSLARFFGFLQSTIIRKPRLIPQQLIRFIRGEQLRRLLRPLGVRPDLSESE